MHSLMVPYDGDIKSCAIVTAGGSAMVGVAVMRTSLAAEFTRHGVRFRNVHSGSKPPLVVLSEPGRLLMRKPKKDIAVRISRDLGC